MALIKFNKPALSIAQQVQLWQSRGLAVTDSDKAVHFLKFIGYYRFSAYALPYQDCFQPNKNFRPNTTFEQILSLYIFDRELRLLVLDAIERIEVAVRACLVNEMCFRHGAHWFMEPSHFIPPPPPHVRRAKPRFSHTTFLNKIDEELGIPPSDKIPSRPHNEVFINHYYSHYSDPYLPPSWMVFEVLSINRMSQVFSNLADSKDRIAIASHFGIDEQVLKNWLHCLSYVRNVCAHHRRLWNRQLVIKPIMAKKLDHLVPVKDRFFAVAVILHYMMGTVAPKSMWHKRLYDLIQTSPLANLQNMGFPANWQADSFWESK